MTAAPAKLVASTVMLAGTAIGWNVTATSNPAVRTLSRVSVDVQLTCRVPIENFVPEAGTQLTGRLPSTRSVALTVKLTTAPDGSFVCTLMSPGTVITGGVVSRMVMSKSCSSVCEPNLAAHSTLVRLIGKVDPEAGEQVTVALLPFQRAVTLNVTTRPEGPVASSVMLLGIVQLHSSPAAASGAAKPASRHRTRTRRIIGSSGGDHRQQEEEAGRHEPQSTEEGQFLPPIVERTRDARPGDCARRRERHDQQQGAGEEAGEEERKRLRRPGLRIGKGGALALACLYLRGDCRLLPVLRPLRGSETGRTLPQRCASPHS